MAERDLVLHHLRASRERLLQAAGSLSAEQRCFRPAEDRWSVADCVEHLVIVENFILGSIKRVLATPPEPAKRSEVQGKEQVILERVPARNIRVKGPEAVMPTQRWPQFDDLLREFETTRQRTMSFASETQADLKFHFFPHPILGDFDCYQWLLFVGTHSERHVRQMEEVKSCEGFPQARAAAT
ncbi:MAG TPA: DinB family protein [Bryobacteraceae bacterium]|nr:DinB family protein [Bryobacteraceae bacterium]